MSLDFDPRLVGRHDFDASLVRTPAKTSYAAGSGRDRLEQRFAEVGDRIRAMSEIALVDRPCPLCANTSGHRQVMVKYGVPIVACGSCDFVFATPVPEPALDPGHPVWETVFEQDHVGFLQSDIYQHYARRRYAYALNMISPFAGGKGGRLLDIGAAVGTFIEVAAEYGWQGCGVEMNTAAAQAGQAAGHAIYEGIFPSVPQLADTQFDLIATLDTIEHVPVPTDFLRDIASAIRPGGLLFIQVPNGAALAARLRGIADNVFNGLIHLNYFSPQSLASMARSTGFEPLRVETVLCEWHAVADHTEEELGAVLDAAPPAGGLTPDWLLDQGLGYKIMAVFRRRP